MNRKLTSLALGMVTIVGLLGSSVTATPAWAEATGGTIVADASDTGTVVSTIQRDLVVTGFLPANQITGIFDAATVEAVKAYQGARGLTVTGVVDTLTSTTLVAESKDVLARPYAQLGSTGDLVKKLQYRLSTGAFLRSSDITGTYGTSTQTAVRQFQAASRLNQTGTADRVTYDRLTAFASYIANNPVYRAGDSGSGVRTYQVKLAVIGLLPPAQISGVYDANFTAGIKRYQAALRVPITGMLDRTTANGIATSYSETYYHAPAKPGDSGATVRSYQTKLAVIRYLAPSAVTGSYGTITTAAVKKFQVAVGLYPGGHLDRVTIGKLDAAYSWAWNNPGLTIGSTGTAVRIVQAKLNYLGYSTAQTSSFGSATALSVRRFQAAQGLYASGRVEAYTNTRLDAAYRTKVALLAKARAVSLDARCMTGRVMCADKTRRKLFWVINGQIQRTFDARFGMPGYDTREGVFPVYAKYTADWSYLYKVWMPYAMYFSGGQAVHYSAQFASVGYTMAGSHGCINLRDYSGIAWLFGQVRVGDRVVVYRS